VPQIVKVNLAQPSRQASRIPMLLEVGPPQGSTLRSDEHTRVGTMTDETSKMIADVRKQSGRDSHHAPACKALCRPYQPGAITQLRNAHSHMHEAVVGVDVTPVNTASSPHRSEQNVASSTSSRDRSGSASAST
jgi:hypothetical protein